MDNGKRARSWRSACVINLSVTQGRQGGRAGALSIYLSIRSSGQGSPDLGGTDPPFLDLDE